jgi:hypothetical protein
MAKVRIPVEQLPPPDKNGDHVFQFRIISEDRNNISSWSNLYVIKSIGQYRPLESSYVFVSSSPIVSVTWDTPTIYNYNSASITSASISHNHSQNFKQHETDVFVQWGSGSVMGNFEYHERSLLDSTNIIIEQGKGSVRIIGLVATKDIPRKEQYESQELFNQRLNSYLGLSASVQGTYDLMKVFDTGIISL